MSALTFFGCLFVSFGPVTALFLLTVARNPQDVIILIASGFFWLLSLLLSAIWWLIVSPLKDQLAFGAIFSILFQEGFRYLFFRLLKKADSGMLSLSVTDNTVLHKHRLAYVSGMGFGLVQGIFSYTNVLKETSGPGIVGLSSKGDEYFFLNSAFLATAFILLHIFWGVIFFDGCDKSSYWKVLFVLISHLIASLTTLLNEDHDATYSIVISYVLLLASIVVAFHVVAGPNRLRNLRALFT